MKTKLCPTGRGRRCGGRVEEEGKRRGGGGVEEEVWRWRGAERGYNWTKN